MADTTIDRPPTTEAEPLDWHRAIRAALGLTALLSLLVLAFAWPPSELEPRDLPVAVAAPSPEAAEGIDQHLASALGDEAIDTVPVNDREAAVAAIEDREAYGALVVGPDGTEVLTATGAGPVVAQLLSRAADRMAAEQGTPVTVTDVVATADGDPRGVVFNAAALPLAIGGIIIGAVTSIALRRTRERLVAALLVGAGSGLAIAGILQGALDALEGSYWANSGVIALGVLAVALPIVGLRHVVGMAGIGVMSLLILLLGNPLSGVTSAPELLPLGWLGQLLPPGAVGTALRGTSYFDGAGVGIPLLVLACWAGVGLLLTLLPHKE
jgi:hypothetical protein